MANIIQTFPKGAGSGGGGGHVIVNSEGTELEQREKLKFRGVTVTDDSTNEQTVVDVTGKSDLTNLAPAFDPATPYTTGNRVTNNGKLYRFTADHTGAWDIADVDEVDVDTELQVLCDSVGDTSDLTTTHKTDLVSAVNELDSDKQDVIMKSTMPTASADLVGKTFQYIGATNNDFKHNYFYECVNDGGTYKWENSKVQDTVTVDSALSDTSENPVQNKVIEGALGEKQDKEFVGTHLAWSALSDADKAKFNLVNFTDDALSDRISPLTGYTPIGTVISLMGTQAPRHYLKCDGAVYNISSYPELADYFEGQFGTKNHFGGDGTTTFAVPDLQGEFLRGTGTNSHIGEGSGENVGVHQAATGIYGCTSSEVATVTTGPTTPDVYTPGASRSVVKKTNSDNSGFYFKTRPTNTSVLYCIATKDIYIDPAHNYSTNEQVIGTWIDGKPLYQKTINFGALPNATTKNVEHGISNLNFVVSIEGMAYRDTGYSEPFPLGNANTKIFQTGLGINSTHIFIDSRATDKSMYLGYATIRYTKTTD